MAVTPEQVAHCMRLRWTVFVEEQGVAPHEEIDGQDEAATHFLAASDGTPVGAARLRAMDGHDKIQRVCVLREHRGDGVGAAIIRHMVQHVAAEGRVHLVRLGAQTHALEFYRRLGFREFGGGYLDAGIPHRDMELHL